MEARLEQIKANRKEPTQKVWLHLEQKDFRRHHKDGDCSMNDGIAPKHCRFTHPWIENDADGWAFEPEHMVHGLHYTKKFFKEMIKKILLVVGGVALLLLFVLRLLCTRMVNPRRPSAGTASAKKKN